MRAREKGFEYMSLDDFEEALLDKPEHERWELIGGRVIRGMVGARWEHKRIIQNFTVAFMNTFRQRGSDCRPYDETFWLKERFLDLAVFPDVMVRCGSLEPDAIALNDPVVLIEVVSRGSAQRDRFEKWNLYRQLPSVQHYVLAERERIWIDVFDRTPSGGLAREPLADSAADLALPAIDFSMPVAEAYRDVIGN
jgi:Uma2 family endonuclease